jgi:hypothetical protein
MADSHALSQAPPPDSVAQPRAADDYRSCIDYATCRSEGFHCYKRATLEFAQCRPETGTRCVEAGLWDPMRHSTRDWLCPGWEYCAARHGNCAYSRCCQNALDACLSRHDNYAQCIPTYTNATLFEQPSEQPTGEQPSEDRTAIAEQTACSGPRQMGWDCRKLQPETSSCGHDCTRTAPARALAAPAPSRGAVRAMRLRVRACKSLHATRRTLSRRALGLVSPHRENSSHHTV